MREKLETIKFRRPLQKNNKGKRLKTIKVFFLSFFSVYVVSIIDFNMIIWILASDGIPYAQCAKQSRCRKRNLIVSPKVDLGKHEDLEMTFLKLIPNEGKLLKIGPHAYSWNSFRTRGAPKFPWMRVGSFLQLHFETWWGAHLCATRRALRWRYVDQVGESLGSEIQLNHERM